MMSVDITPGIGLFNQHDFFAAHDYFEDLWRDAPAKDRLFYQGLVQISVGSYHFLNENYKGALSQYRKGTEKLSGYRPIYSGVDLVVLLKGVERLINALELFFEGETEKVTYKNIPEIIYNCIQ